MKMYYTFWFDSLSIFRIDVTVKFKAQTSKDFYRTVVNKISLANNICAISEISMGLHALTLLHQTEYFHQLLQEKNKYVALSNVILFCPRLM